MVGIDISIDKRTEQFRFKFKGKCYATPIVDLVVGAEVPDCTFDDNGNCIKHKYRKITTEDTEHLLQIIADLLGIDIKVLKKEFKKFLKDYVKNMQKDKQALS